MNVEDIMEIRGLLGKAEAHAEYASDVLNGNIKLSEDANVYEIAMAESNTAQALTQVAHLIIAYEALEE